MNKKIISKILGLSLIGTLTFTSLPSPVIVQALTTNNSVISSGQNSTSNNAVSILEGIEKNGTKISENEFKIEEENYNAIINSETGDITHNYYDENGILVDSYSTNFYENLKNISQVSSISNQSIKPISSIGVTEPIYSIQSTLITNSTAYKLDSLHYTVSQYSSGQKLYAQSSNNAVKNYYLSGKYTSNSTVMAFINAVDNTASKARLLVNVSGSAVAIGLIGILGITGKVTAAAVTAALKALGYVTLVGGAASMSVLYNNYADARIAADHKFNAL